MGRVELPVAYCSVSNGELIMMYIPSSDSISTTAEWSHTAALTFFFLTQMLVLFTN